jgi:hypothetical protein
MSTVKCSLSVGITVLMVAENAYAYCKKLAFLKSTSSWCVHPVKFRLKTGLTEGLPVETAAKDGICETFQLNFQ